MRFRSANKQSITARRQRRAFFLLTSMNRGRGRSALPFRILWHPSHKLIISVLHLSPPFQNNCPFHPHPESHKKDCIAFPLCSPFPITLAYSALFACPFTRSGWKSPLQASPPHIRASPPARAYAACFPWGSLPSESPAAHTQQACAQPDRWRGFRPQGPPRP